MTFSYVLDDEVGKVRFEISDTVENGALFSDEEITYKLAEHDDDVLLAAAALCDVLATRYADEFDIGADEDRTFKRSQKAAMYARRAAALRERAAADASGGPKSIGVLHVDRPRPRGVDLATGRRPWRS